mmetsp:Transcript_22249/g.56168  ORF Transcript_22249/g.56168 Transcript_22249/m.56168 type:complete len:237 (-) Transcript_22249:1254-1964(-)
MASSRSHKSECEAPRSRWAARCSRLHATMMPRSLAVLPSQSFPSISFSSASSSRNEIGTLSPSSSYCASTFTSSSCSWRRSCSFFSVFFFFVSASINGSSANKNSGKIWTVLSLWSRSRSQRAVVPWVIVGAFSRICDIDSPGNASMTSAAYFLVLVLLGLSAASCFNDDKELRNAPWFAPVPNGPMKQDRIAEAAKQIGGARFFILLLSLWNGGSFAIPGSHSSTSCIIRSSGLP